MINAAPVVATAVQFPYRLGLVLTIAVAGLLASAIDTCLRRQANRQGGRPAILLTLFAITVILGGIFT